jgi:hypothetical protein
MSPDILHGIGGGDLGSPDNLYAFHADGSPVAGFPITLTGPVIPSALITDIDFDSDVDIVYGGWDSQVHVWDMPFAYHKLINMWPTFGGNTKRDGVVYPFAFTSVEEPGDIPFADQLTIGSAYPNPFNPSITIRLYLPEQRELDLGVYDLQGRRVRTLHTGGISSGWHSMVWDGKDDAGRGQASGIYFMRGVSAEDVVVRKMMLVK